jgi:FtsH-binding integral membrane protein
LLSTVLIVALIFIIMSGIVYMYPEFFKSTYGFAMGSLLLILILIIIFELSMYFFSKGYAFSQTHRTVSYVVIVVFSLLVSYDTSRIFMLADRCVNYPNYPKSSITFFLDVINLFARIISLRSR